MRPLRPHLLAALITAVLLPPAGAGADDQHRADQDRADQDRAREDVDAGRILPLSAIVARAAARFGGTVLDAEYEVDDDEEDGGRPHGRRPRNRYEVKLLTADGRILELDYDAVTGELLGQRGRERDHERHRGGRGGRGGEE